MQVVFKAFAPLDSREECAVSLTGDTRKLTVVGSIPELGNWSLRRGTTLRQAKAGVSNGLHHMHPSRKHLSRYIMTCSRFAADGKEVVWQSEVINIQRSKYAWGR